MIEIIGTELYQWDTGRSVRVTGIDATEVHFANQGDSKAPIMDLVNSEAKIPDYLLMTGKQLCVYAVANGVTIERKMFSVKKRERPENYVYEEDQRNLIYALITDAQEATTAANQASGNANTAAESANQATKNANASAATANKASENANLAAKNANESAAKAAHTAKSLMVVGEAEGEVIALNDAVEMPLVGLRVFGKTTQDGTPTPVAPAELVSAGNGGALAVNVCGKNLANYDAITGVVTRVDADGFIITNNSSDRAVYVHVPIVAPYGEITVGIENINGTDLYIQKEGSDYNLNSSSSFSPTVNANGWLRVMWSVSAGATAKVRVMAVRGSKAMPYEPFKNQTVTVSTPDGLHGIPVTSGGNYIDASGQRWLCDEIDFSRGVCVQRTAAKAFDGTENWLYSANNNYYVLDHSELGSVNTKQPYCSHFAKGGDGYGHFFSGESGFAFFHTATSVGEWKAFLAEQYTNGTPVKLVYSLAEPIETPLSEEELTAYAALHTYRDNTTVSNDAGAWMELEYVMDAKKYIDSLIPTSGIIPATVE